MNDIKKAALVEEGQPADLTAQRKATEAYHADGNLSNERDRAWEWLHKMAEAAKDFKFEEGIGVYFLCDGVHMTGIFDFAKMFGFVLTSKDIPNVGLYEVSFYFEGVKFYELFAKATYEEG